MDTAANPIRWQETKIHSYRPGGPASISLLSPISKIGFPILSTKIWGGIFAIASAAVIFGCASEENELAVESVLPVAVHASESMPTPQPSATFTPTLVPTSAPASSTAEVARTSIPTATLVPTATIPSSPPATSRTLAKHVWDLVVMLAEDLSPRESATEEELVAAEFLADEFDRLGYNVVISPFLVTDGWPIGAMSEVTSGSYDEAILFDTFAGPSPEVQGIPVEPVVEGDAEGELVYVGRGDAAEVELLDLEGKVALAEFGFVSLETKYVNVLEAGAIALVIFDNRDSRRLRWERINSEAEIPMFIVRRLHGLKLIDKMDAGEEVIISTSVERLGNGPSRNVIAELNNNFDDDGVLILGAHYDTTPDSSGANDNGTGIAVLIVLAQEMKDDELPFDLRFILFGSEETGLHGSNRYVADLSLEELSRINAMINIDSIGLGRIAVEDSGGIADVAIDVAEELEIDLLVKNIGYAASDHAPFMDAGVDVMFMYGSDLQYVNSPEDTLERVEPEPMGHAIEIVMGVIEELIEDTDEQE